MTGPLDLDFTDLQVVEVPETSLPTGGGPVYYGPPGSLGRCPDCGRELKILKSGDLWAHKCADGQMTEPSKDVPAGPTSTPGTANTSTKTTVKKGRTPEKVQVLWVALSASGTEWTAREVIARNTGAPKQIIPVDLGDNADDMLRPILDAIWPRLPKGAQKALVAVADEAGLVLAAMMWGQYIKALNQWQQEYLRTARPQAQPTPVHQQNGAPHGVNRQTEGQQGADTVGPGWLSPFQPAVVVADAG